MNYESTHTGLSIAGVCERDIDLLLLEEILANPQFVDWFCGQALGIPGPFGLIFVEHSVTQANGESDLELTVRAPGGHDIHLLVENKVNAGLQPQQAERYRIRGGCYQTQGRCHDFRTVLVAPERYFGVEGALKGFDSRITYEELRNWFDSSSALGPRALYKVALLSSAIQKGTLGYQLIPDDPVSEFWQKYWRRVSELAPELEMPRPPLKASGSSFVTFRPPTLPKGVAILHKLCKGNSDLQFSGFASRLSDLQQVFAGVLEKDMYIDKATRSGVVRIKVPVLNVANSFEGQIAEVDEGIHAAKRLFRWFTCHKARWMSFQQESPP